MHKTTTLAEDLESPSKSREPKTLTFFVTFLENFGSDINVEFNSESLLFTVKDNKFSVGSVAGRIYPARLLISASVFIGFD